MTIVARTINTNSPRRNTDWTALDALTDEDLAQAAAYDTDAAPLMTDDDESTQGVQHHLRS